MSALKSVGLNMSEALKIAVKENAQTVAQTMVLRKDLCTARHLETLFQVAMHSDSQIAASLKLLDVLQLSDLKPDLLKDLVKQGLVINAEDIRKAIFILADDQVELLEVLINKVKSSLDYTDLWDLAIKEKPKIAEHFLTCGAKPNVIDVIDLLNWKIIHDCDWMIKYITENCSPHERTILIVKAVDNGKKDLARKELMVGPILGSEISALHVLRLCEGNPTILKHAIKQGVIVTEMDIKNAITHKPAILSDEHIELLKVLINEVKSSLDYNSLWHLAIKEKPKIAEHFLTCGAKPNVIDVINRLNWKIIQDCDWMIKYITENCSPHERAILIVKAVNNGRLDLARKELMVGPILGSKISALHVLRLCEGNPIILQHAIKQGVIVTEMDIKNAITHKPAILSDEHIELLKVLINEVKSSLDYNSLWHLAIKEKPKIAEHFLTCGAKPNVIDVINRLNWKIIQDCDWMIKYITENCSPHERAILIVKAVNNGRLDLARKELMVGPILGSKISALHVLRLCEGNPIILQHAIKQGVIVTEMDIKNAITHKPAILSDEHIELLKVLINEVKCPLNYNSLWHLAIKEKPKIAEHFLTCGAKPNVIDVINRLNWKIIHDCDWMIKYITENCSPHERTILIVKAVDNGKIDLARKELMVGPILGSEISALHVLCLCEGNPTILKHAIKQGVIVTEMDIKNAITHKPAILSDEHTELFKVLINEVKFPVDYNSLWHLAIKEKPRLAKEFLINCSQHGRTRLTLEAIKDGKEHLVKDILAGGSITGSPALIEQVFNNCGRLTPDLLKELIKHGMKITANEIKIAISKFSDCQVELLAILTKEAKDCPDYKQLLHLAAKDRPSFAKHFLTYGVKLSIDDVMSFIKSVKSQSLLWLVEYVTENFSPHQMAIIFAKAVENKRIGIDFAKQVLLTRHIAGSEIKTSQVLKICGSDVNILKAAIACGMIITADDIRGAIQTLSDEQLEVLTNELRDPFEYSKLWHDAVVKGKPLMAMHILVTCGAKPSVEHIIDIPVAINKTSEPDKLKAYQYYILIQYISNNCSPHERTECVVKAVEKGNIALAQLLMSKRSIVGKEISILHVLRLCVGGKQDLLKHAIEQGVTITTDDVRNAITVKPAILLDEHIELLKVLTDKIKDTDLKAVDFTTLCQVAIKNKRPCLANHFLECGAKPTVSDVMKVLKWEKFDICSCMFYYAAEHCSDVHRTTLVLRAIENGKEDFAKHLLSGGPIVRTAINIPRVLRIHELKPNQLKDLIVHGMTITLDDIKIAINTLSDKQVELLKVITHEVKDTPDYTPLWCTTARDKPLLAKHLLTCGAQPSAAQVMEKIDWIKSDGCIWMVEYISKKCNPDERGRFVLKSLENGNEAFVKRFLSEGQVNLSVSRVLKISGLKPDILEELILHGMTISAEDIEIAIYVLSENHTELLSVLTKKAQNHPDYTRLWYLSIKDKPRLAEHFFMCGAKPSICDIFDVINWDKLEGCMIEYIFENCSSDERTEFVVKAIEKNQMDVAKQALVRGPIIGSKVNCKHILSHCRKEPDLFQQLIRKGMTITTENIRSAITCKHIHSDELVDLLNVLTDEVKNDIDFTTLWHVVIRGQPKLAKHFLTFGAKPNVTDAINVLDWGRIDVYDWLVKYITDNGSSKERAVFVVKATENKKLSLAKQVLLAGSNIGSEIRVVNVLSLCEKEPHLLNELINQGMQVTIEDIRSAITVLSDEQVQLLEMLTNKLGHSHEYTSMCSLTIRDKPKMAEHFLKCGAQPSVSDVMGGLIWKRFDEYSWMFYYCAEKCTPDERTTLVVTAIENGKEDFAKQLLSGGPLVGNKSTVPSVLRNHGLKPDLLKDLIVHGMTISAEDIKNSVSLLSDQQENLLSVLTDHVEDSPDYVSLWYQSKDKPKLASHFLKCWAQCSEAFENTSNQSNDYDHMSDYISRHCSAHSRTSLLVKAIENKDEHFAEQLLTGGPICGDEINLGLIISSLPQFPLPVAHSLLEKLLDNGVDPNGVPNTGRKPIEILLLLQDMDSTVVSSLLCTLLKQVPSIDNAELDDIQSTVIHEVTKLSLKAGRFMLLLCHFKS